MDTSEVPSGAPSDGGNHPREDRPSDQGNNSHLAQVGQLFSLANQLAGRPDSLDQPGSAPPGLAVTPLNPAPGSLVTLPFVTAANSDFMSTLAHVNDPAGILSSSGFTLHDPSVTAGLQPLSVKAVSALDPSLNVATSVAVSLNHASASFTFRQDEADVTSLSADFPRGGHRSRSMSRKVSRRSRRDRSSSLKASSPGVELPKLLSRNPPSVTGTRSSAFGPRPESSFSTGAEGVLPSDSGPLAQVGALVGTLEHTSCAGARPSVVSPRPNIGFSDCTPAYQGYHPSHLAAVPSSGGLVRLSSDQMGTLVDQLGPLVTGTRPSILGVPSYGPKTVALGAPGLDDPGQRSTVGGTLEQASLRPPAGFPPLPYGSHAVEGGVPFVGSVLPPAGLSFPSGSATGGPAGRTSLPASSLPLSFGGRGPLAMSGLPPSGPSGRAGPVSDRPSRLEASLGPSSQVSEILASSCSTYVKGVPVSGAHLGRAQHPVGSARDPSADSLTEVSGDSASCYRSDRGSDTSESSGRSRSRGRRSRRSPCRRPNHHHPSRRSERRRRRSGSGHRRRHSRRSSSSRSPPSRRAKVSRRGLGPSGGGVDPLGPSSVQDFRTGASLVPASALAPPPKGFRVVGTASVPALSQVTFAPLPSQGVVPDVPQILFPPKPLERAKEDLDAALLRHNQGLNSTLSAGVVSARSSSPSGLPPFRRVQIEEGRSSSPPRKTRRISPSAYSDISSSSPSSPAQRSTLRSPPVLNPYSPSVGLGAQVPVSASLPSQDSASRAELRRQERLKILEEESSAPKDDPAHKAVLLEAISSLSRICPELTHTPPVSHFASQAERLMNMRKAPVVEPKLLESPFLGHIFTYLHYQLAGEVLPSDVSSLPPLPQVTSLPKAQSPTFLFSPSGRSVPWRGSERRGVLPTSHRVPAGNELYLLNKRADYTSKNQKTGVKLGSIHTLYANSVKTLEELSSSHNFLTGLSSLVAGSASLSACSDLVSLVQASVASVQSAMWEGAKSLYNLELLLRSEALSKVSRLPEQEVRTLRAQAFSPSHLIGPAAVISSCNRLIAERSILEAKVETGVSASVQQPATSSSNKQSKTSRKSKQSSSASSHKPHQSPTQFKNYSKRKHHSYKQSFQKKSSQSKQSKNSQRGPLHKRKGSQ